MDGPRQAAQPPQADALPRRLGDFTAHRVLGSGGSGVVYAAQWGHRDVALKVLRADLVATDTERKRFLDEARALAEIDHAAVVKVLHFGELPDRRPFLAMELVAGETLAARLTGSGPIALPTALDLFDQLAGAVGAMHQRGLVHRDLKPENVILLPGDSYLVLLDFGIAKEVDAKPSTITQEGGIRGTPAYMAPERFFGQPASIQTDLYELGVVLYMMLTGRLPWDRVADPTGRLEPRRPSELGVTLPPALEIQLLRALSTRPEMRPETAREMAAAIRAAAELPPSSAGRATADLAGGAIGPAPPPATPTVGYATTGRPARGRRWLVGAAALLAIGGAATATAIVAGRDQTPAVGTADPTPTPPDPAPVTPPAPSPPPPPRRAADDTRLFTIARHFPGDTRLLVGVRLRELRHSEAFAGVFDRTRDTLYLNLARLYASPCKVDPVEDVDWIAIGSADVAGTDADIVLSGNWTRDRIEACAGDISSALGRGKPERISRDGAVTRLDLPGGPAFLAWLDDHTFLVSTRAAADAAWMGERATGKGSAAEAGALQPILPRLDTQATLWMIGGPPEPELARNLFGDVEPPSPIWVAITIDDQMRAEAGGQSSSAAAATAAAAAIQNRAKQAVEAEPMSGVLLSQLTVTTDADRVLATMKVDAGTTGLFARALEDLLKKGAAQ